MRAALRLLDIDRFVLTAHDAVFPERPDEDIGRGSPGSRGAAGVLARAADDGFDALQLGPQGQLGGGNASPYDAALFARSPLSVAPGRLLDRRLLTPDELAAAVARRPAGADTRVPHAHVVAAHDALMRIAHARFARLPSSREALEAFRARHRDWLEPSLAFDLLTAAHGTEEWRRWPSLDRRLLDPPPGAEDAAAARLGRLRAQRGDEADYRTFCQLLAHEEHERLRERARALGLQLFGDLQVGISGRDAWSLQPLFLPGYALGAPPSRTNPDGQPWGYPVLHPSLHADDAGGPGPVLRFLRRRLDKLFTEYDGLRVDHPHGLVCPWVYRTTGDPHVAVRAGARLVSSPDLDDHPELAPFSIPKRSQLAPAGHPRHADDWVRSLDDAQLERQARAFDLLVECALERGVVRRDIACEVLSTCPMPLRRVLERHALGRFRVTQKADPHDAEDPYRTESAAPADWVMASTHDTPPLRAAIAEWSEDRRRAWAEYLSRRLGRQSSEIVSDDAALREALFADLFVGPARHVKVFFADWLGMDERYNLPGTVSDANWTLRIPRHVRAEHGRRSLHVPRVLALALEARAPGGDAAAVARKLRDC